MCSFLVLLMVENFVKMRTVLQLRNICRGTVDGDAYATPNDSRLNVSYFCCFVFLAIFFGFLTSFLVF